jgi:hypothetical protein
MVRFLAAALLLLLLFSGEMTPATRATPIPLGSDFSRQELETQGQFVKGQIPVHGYWVNWEDVFFYQGDAKAFHQFMEVYRQFRHVQLSVVLHSGAGEARSPWDKESRNLPADWSLYVWKTGVPFTGPADKDEKAPPGKPAPTRVDVWVGKRLKLADLKIPENIAVTASEKDLAADSEISKFLAKRKKPDP